MLINYYPLQSMSMAKGRYVVGRTTATFIFQEKEMKRFFSKQGNAFLTYTCFRRRRFHVRFRVTS